MNCNNNCSSCENSCYIECPVCNKKGIKVKYITVNNLLVDNTYLDKNKEIYLCTSKNCEVVYYQNNNPTIFYKKDVNVPIWYKEKYNKYLVCYCHNIYLDDIVKIVMNDNSNKELSIEDIKKYFKKQKENCELKNPTGISCEKLFKNAIEFAYKQKKIIKENKKDEYLA